MTAVRKARSTTRRSIQNCDGVNCCEIDVTSCCAKRRNDSSYASPKVWYRAVILSLLSLYWKEMESVTGWPPDDSPVSAAPERARISFHTWSHVSHAVELP